MKKVSSQHGRWPLLIYPLKTIFTGMKHLAGGGLLVCIIFLYIKCAGVSWRTGLCLRWLAETQPCAQFSRRNTMKTFSCAPQDCFWPQKPCRKKHKPTSIPLCVCWNVWIFFNFFCLSAAEVVQHAKYYLIKTPLYRMHSQQFCAPASWHGNVTNCLTFIIDTVFNVLRGLSPVLAMVTSVENEPGLCVFQSARPCPGQRCGQTTVHRKWWLVCLI